MQLSSFICVKMNACLCCFGTGSLSGSDLGRMYPTPPSEEQTPFSPVNHPCPELSSSVASYGSNQIGKDSGSGTMHEQFEIEVEENLCSPRPEPLMVRFNFRICLRKFFLGTENQVET